MSIAISAVVAVGLAALFERLNIPAGAMIGSMIGIASLKLSEVGAAKMPGAARFLAFVVVGWILGSTVNAETLSGLREAAPQISVVVGLFLLVGLGLALALYRLSGIDPLTAYLATSPGAIAQVAVLSADSGAKVGIVMSIHLLRVVSVMIAAPLAVKFLST